MEPRLAHEILLAVATAAGLRAWCQLGSTCKAGRSQSQKCLPDVLAFCPAGICVAGGIGALGEALDVADVWCPAVGSWLPLTPMPTARHGCAAATLGPRLFVVGGSDDNLQRLPNVECFHAGEGQWHRCSDMPTARGNCAAVGLHGLLYVVGGSGVDGYLSATEALSLCSGTWTATAGMPSACSLFGAAAVSGLLCVAGGFQGARKVMSTCAAMCQFTGWRLLPPMPTPRAGCGCVGAAGCLYVVGGCDARGNRLGNLERLALRSSSWEKLEEMPTPRRCFAAVALSGCLYVFGGSDAHSEERSSRVTAASEQALLGSQPSWRSIEPMPTKRYACAGGVLIP